MAIPTLKDARLYYRCAIQRYEDAKILLHASHTTGAVYLAGYGVECILKALDLSIVPVAKVESVFRSFRGPRAHSFEQLRDQYLTLGGARFPRVISRAFILVQAWSTALRYEPATTKEAEAQGFMTAVDEIIRWANGRL